MSRIRELLNNTFLFTVSQFASKLLVFLMVPLYTAYLTTDDYGMSNLLTTSVGLLTPLLTLCISEAVLRYVIEDKSNADSYLKIGLKIIVIGTIVASCISPLINLILHVDFVYLIFIPVLFFVQSIQNLLSFFSRGIDKVKSTAIAGVIQTFITVVSNIVLIVFLKQGVLGYLLSMVLGNVFAAIYLIYSCNIKSYIIASPDVQKDLTISMIKYSCPLVPNNLSWWLIDSSSTYIITAFIGVSAVGVYAAASKIPTIATVFSGLFMQAWLLSVLNEYNKDGGKQYIESMYGVFNCATLWFCSLLILFSKEISLLLLRGDFYEGWVYTPLLICSVYYGGLSGFLGTIYSAEKKTKHYFTSTIVGGLFTVVLNICLIKHIGLHATSIAVCVGYLVIWLLRFFTTQKYISLRLSFIDIFNNLLLIVSSVLVIKGYRLYAIICFMLIVVLTYDQMKVIFTYLKSISNRGNVK